MFSSLCECTVGEYIRNRRLTLAGYEIIDQEPGLEGMYKAAELPGRICYGSQDKMAPGTAERFCNGLMKSNHGAPLEHGTVYLKAPKIYGLSHGLDLDANCEVCALDKYYFNKYSKCKEDDDYMYITTNLRVLFENGWMDDLKYWCEPTEHHEKRVQVRFTVDRFTGEEFLRHRVASFNRESTRYVLYTKEKFGGGSIKYIVPVWMLDKQDAINTYKDFDSNSPCLVGYVPNAKSLLSSPHKHGSSYYYINTKNDIKIRLYADYDSVDDLPSSIKPLSYIINNKGQSIAVTTIDLKKDDFMSGKYPLKEWFDYTIPTYNLPIGNFLLRITLHINNKLYIDYLAVSEVDKTYKGEYLLSNLTKALKYSSVGEAIWCKDRRNSDAIDYNGVSLRFDGEQFRTFDGRTISELPLAKYTITSNLTNCTGTNSNTSALLNTRYTTTISAASGYSLTDADIICTMSGNPVTVTNRKINISKVTGDIIITATAKQIFNVTNNLTNCVSSNTDATVIEGSTYNATITANDGYTLDSVTCTMGGVDQTVNDGAINISSVTGDIVITATTTPSQP